MSNKAATRGQVDILHQDWCKGCGICVYVCPTDVLTLEKETIVVKNPEKCIGCLNCELSCPDFVLKVVKVDG